ncbi:hypothetical protein FC697_22200 [Bacillus wiedmannii]|uniref:hypothetical protein n=1 Tax=Bacillus wiedmannii TaxID=1890302 RepID=UPI0010BD9FF0|nr:hypothetical protein [Bacillus wiedmannii]TKH17451.1 hypothetical protein FC697_22200 [Bacillus wiedmannii]
MNKLSTIEHPVLVDSHRESVLSLVFILSRQPQKEELYEAFIKKYILTFEVILLPLFDMKKVKFTLLVKTEI